MRETRNRLLATVNTGRLRAREAGDGMQSAPAGRTWVMYASADSLHCTAHLNLV